MAKQSAITEQWFADKGFIKNPDGSYSPPPLKSNYVRSQKAKNILDEAEKKVFVKQVVDEFTQLGKNSNPLAVFNVNPIGKPRMTQRDKWLDPPRKAVANYWAYKATLIADALKYNFTMPECNYHIMAIIQMPHSWGTKKCNLMDGAPHQQKPDKDNIEKGILDALLKDDSKVWDGRITKRWGRSGKIVVYEI